MTKIDFEFETEFGVFRDALVFFDDVVPSTEEVEQMKQQRLQNWIALVTPQPPVQE